MITDTYNKIDYLLNKCFNPKFIFYVLQPKKLYNESINRLGFVG